MNSIGFPPVSRCDARILILGTLPGQMSLQRRQYYAQPRNAFWSIMGKCFGFTVELAYVERLDALLKNRIALWDVCASAYRPGSLDTAIRNVVANDFAEFFVSHPQIKMVCFNGSMAEKLYNREVLATLPGGIQRLRYHRLPSTSPAHAGMPFVKKCEAWGLVLGESRKII